jgi:hypothetical protein
MKAIPLVFAPLNCCGKLRRFKGGANQKTVGSRVISFTFAKAPIVVFYTALMIKKTLGDVNHHREDGPQQRCNHEEKRRVKPFRFTRGVHAVVDICMQGDVQ